MSITSVEARCADWIGKRERRFNWRAFRFECGRWHYQTNYNGETLASWWVQSTDEPDDSRLYDVVWFFADETGEERVSASNFQSAARDVREKIAERMRSSVEFVRIASMTKVSP